MITLVCGGRNYADRLFLCDFLNDRRESITLIITGAQRKAVGPFSNNYVGADWLAQEWAINNEIDYMGFPAKWKKFGDAAGPARNAAMAYYFESQLGNKQCIAFPGHNGTRNMISVCKAARIPVILAGWR